MGAVPDVVVSTPDELSVRHDGNALPLLETAQFLYGVTPPLPCNCTEKAEPTAPVRLLLVVVTVGVAGTVMVAVPVFEVSAMEVAVTVTVCAELVGAGAINVVELVVEPERVPALLVHVTPAVFLSLDMVAVKVVVF